MHDGEREARSRKESTSRRNGGSRCDGGNGERGTLIMVFKDRQGEGLLQADLTTLEQGMCCARLRLCVSVCV